jgi:hypothetical protein
VPNVPKSLVKERIEKLMTTEKPYATAWDNFISPPSLMEQASQSTTNLGWLQGYLLDWQTARSVVIRILEKQEQQKTKDEAAHTALCEFRNVADRKITVLQAAYEKAYSKHERLMIRLNEEISHD